MEIRIIFETKNVGKAPEIVGTKMLEKRRRQLGQKCQKSTGDSWDKMSEKRRNYLNKSVNSRWDRMRNFPSRRLLFWNPKTEQAGLDVPMIIFYIPNKSVRRTDLIGFFITRCRNPEYSRIASFTGGISHCNHICPTSRIVLTMLIFDSLNA